MDCSPLIDLNQLLNSWTMPEEYRVWKMRIDEIQLARLERTRLAQIITKNSLITAESIIVPTLSDPVIAPAPISTTLNDERLKTRDVSIFANERYTPLYHWSSKGDFE